MVDISFLSFYSITMKLDYDTAAATLSQLGNITRLKIVRELVRAGDAGMPVGEIRNIDGIVSFLTEECCAADPAQVK